MSLGHVYIVLEPIWSARLTFDDHRYYEFMCFDVPKVVRSPRCDHGHDKESRNGRDINIDIMEGYVWTSEWFRVSSGICRSTGGLPEPPGSHWALMGLSGREEEAARWRAHPQAQSELGGGSAPFPSLLVPLPSSPTPTREGGILLPPGVGLPFFLLGVGEGRKRKEEGKEGAGPPPNPDWALGGAPPPLLLSLPFP